MNRLGLSIGPRSSHARRVMLSMGAATLLIAQAVPSAAQTAASSSTGPTIAYSLDLPGGQTAKVFSNGVAAVFSKDRRKVEFRSFPVTPQYDEMAVQTGLPDKAHLIADLAAGVKAPFAEGRVLAVSPTGGPATAAGGRGQGGPSPTTAAPT